MTEHVDDRIELRGRLKIVIIKFFALHRRCGRSRNVEEHAEEQRVLRNRLRSRPGELGGE